MVKQKAIFHNKFDVVVKDAKTGQIKQKAVAYNTILNQGLDFLCNHIYNDFNAYCNLMQQISVGAGTATPAVTDTALTTPLSTYTTTAGDGHYAYPTSYRTASITIPAIDSNCNGKIITEVGLIAHSYYDEGTWGWQDEYNCLMTKALLKDGEGNPISINKTSTDVIVITATLYLTLTNSGFGDRGVYPAAKDALLTMVVLGFGGYPYRANIYYSFKNIDTANDILFACYKYIESYYGAFRPPTGASAPSTEADSPVYTLYNTMVTNHLIRSIGCPWVGIINFPDHSVFSPVAVAGQAIGTGNGTTKDFSIGIPLLMANSEKIYVNGTALTKGTDYTIEYDNNCIDDVFDYPSVSCEFGDKLLAFGDNVKATSIDKSAEPCEVLSSNGFDPYGDSSNLRGLQNSSSTITNAKPIEFDFGSATKCNILKILGSNIPTSMNIEYSSDGTTWTAATNIVNSALSTMNGTPVTGQCYKFDAVSARYWRIYSATNFSLSPVSYTFNGVSSNQYLFLGYTDLGLHFTTAPASGAAITADYNFDVPYHTANNMLQLAYSIMWGRG